MFKINGKKNKSLISIDGIKSDFISCNVGVRQGKNQSPFLFHYTV